MAKADTGTANRISGICGTENLVIAGVTEKGSGSEMADKVGTTKGSLAERKEKAWRKARKERAERKEKAEKGSLEKERRKDLVQKKKWKAVTGVGLQKAFVVIGRLDGALAGVMNGKAGKAPAVHDYFACI